MSRNGGNGLIALLAVNLVSEHVWLRDAVCLGFLKRPCRSACGDCRQPVHDAVPSAFLMVLLVLRSLQHRIIFICRRLHLSA